MTCAMTVCPGGAAAVCPDTPVALYHRDAVNRRARRRHDGMVREHAKLTNDVARIKRVLEPEDNPGEDELCVLRPAIGTTAFHEHQPRRSRS